MTLHHFYLESLAELAECHKRLALQDQLLYDQCGLLQQQETYIEELEQDPLIWVGNMWGGVTRRFSEWEEDGNGWDRLLQHLCPGYPPLKRPWRSVFNRWQRNMPIQQESRDKRKTVEL